MHRRLQATDTWLHRRMLRIPWAEKVLGKLNQRGHLYNKNETHLKLSRIHNKERRARKFDIHKTLIKKWKLWITSLMWSSKWMTEQRKKLKGLVQYNLLEVHTPIESLLISFKISNTCILDFISWLIWLDNQISHLIFDIIIKNKVKIVIFFA